MEPFGGCLCIGCLEKRLGGRLKPKDFQRGHPVNYPNVPGTPRLMNRRGEAALTVNHFAKQAALQEHVGRVGVAGAAHHLGEAVRGSRGA